MLILHDYCWTICPMCCSKTSDISVETSDMSGCLTVFQKHCFPLKKVYTYVKYDTCTPNIKRDIHLKKI